VQLCVSFARQYFNRPSLMFCRCVSYILSSGSVATENDRISYLRDRDSLHYSFDIRSRKFYGKRRLYVDHFFKSHPNRRGNRCVMRYYLPLIHRKCKVAFLSQGMYAYRLRILSRLKFVSWCIGAVRKSKIIYRSMNDLISSCSLLRPTLSSLSSWHNSCLCLFFLSLCVARRT
jgi:hypothetical protein